MALKQDQLISSNNYLVTGINTEKRNLVVVALLLVALVVAALVLLPSFGHTRARQALLTEGEMSATEKGFVFPVNRTYEQRDLGVSYPFDYGIRGMQGAQAVLHHHTDTGHDDTGIVILDLRSSAEASEWYHHVKGNISSTSFDLAAGVEAITWNSTGLFRHHDTLRLGTNGQSVMFLQGPFVVFVEVNALDLELDSGWLKAVALAQLDKLA